MNPNERQLYIDNLTPYQVEMLDHMWQLDSQEEYFQWFELLEPEDQELAQGLQRLLVLAMIEQAIERELHQCTEAREYLKRFRLQ